MCSSDLATCGSLVRQLAALEAARDRVLRECDEADDAHRRCYDCDRVIETTTIRRLLALPGDSTENGEGT